MRKEKSMERVCPPSGKRERKGVGEDRAVLLPVEPYTAHVYWNLGEERMRPPSKSARPVLRFHDITGREPGNPSGSFDVEIDLRAGRWYVPLWSAGRSYVVELGVRNGKGRFHPLVRTNPAHFPPAHPAEDSAEEYMLVLGDAERGVLIVRDYEAGHEQAPEPTTEPEVPEREERYEPIPPVPPVFFSEPIRSFMREREPAPPKKKRTAEAKREPQADRDLTAEAEASFAAVSAAPLPGYPRD